MPSVLIACEYSARVRDAFRALGHDAWSCDLEACEGNPRWHICGDCFAAIASRRWDLMIAHPPCTHIAVSGAAHFKAKRADGRQQAAVNFFMLLAQAPVPRIAIENPVCIMSSVWRKPDQTIQPWQFGEDASKATCLWLKGLPLLVPTKTIPPTRLVCKCGIAFDSACGPQGCPDCEENTKVVKGIYENQTGSGQNRLTPGPDRWKERSRTYQGIADAMAAQWGAVL